jgi:hypothetical protein
MEGGVKIRTVCHGKRPGSPVRDLKVFVVKVTSVNALSPRAVALDKVTLRI